MIGLILNPANYFFNITGMIYFTSGIIIAAEAVFILLQNRKSMVNFSFFLCNIFAGIWQTGVGFIYSSSSEQTALIWSRYYSWLGIIFVTPAVYLLSENWKGEVSKNKSRFIYFNFLTAFIIYLICVSSPYIVKGLWHFSWGLYPQAGPGELPFIIWFYVLMILSFRNFILSYVKEKSPIRKSQTKFIIIAFLFGFLGSLDYVANYGVRLYTFASISVLFFSTTVAYNIIRYRLMEIETVIHKTIAWFFTCVALIIPFAVLFYVARPWYAAMDTVSAFAVIGAMLLLFLLFVSTLQPKVDHFFQRRRYVLEEVSNRFTEELVHLKGLDNLIHRLRGIITNTLYVQKINIFIYDKEKKALVSTDMNNKHNGPTGLKGEDRFLDWLRKNDRIVHREFIDTDPLYEPVREEAKDYFNSTGAVVLMPLVLNERLVGVINLSKKANLRRYNAADFNFLNILKNQSTIAISNSLLYENMEDQVRQRTKELMEVQKQLIQAEKLATVGTLAGGVAHEINNPLTAILANAQMLLADNALDSQLDRESLELIEEATKRCRTVVQKLMTYAKKPLESSEVSKIDLSDAVRNVVSFLSYQLEQDNIKISVNSKAEEYLIRGNHNEMEQVVTNIVLNSRDAIKQIKKSGTIHISLSKNGDWIKLQVTDEGAGIPEEIMSKIFDPFFTTKEVGKGLGLGLSICQAIVEKHRGQITVQSELNKGSAITVLLPRAKIRTVLESEVK